MPCSHFLWRGSSLLHRRGCRHTGRKNKIVRLNEKEFLVHGKKFFLKGGLLAHQNPEVACFFFFSTEVFKRKRC